MFFCSAVLQAFGFFFLIFAKTKATEWPKARIPIFCFCSYVGGYVYDDGKKFFFFFFFFFLGGSSRMIHTAFLLTIPAKALKRCDAFFFFFFL